MLLYIGLVEFSLIFKISKTKFPVFEDPYASGGFFNIPKMFMNLEINRIHNLSRFHFFRKPDC